MGTLYNTVSQLFTLVLKCNFFKGVLPKWLSNKMLILFFMSQYLPLAIITVKAQSLEWQQNYGGDHWDVANDIKPTSDGGYIVAGQTFSDDQDVSGNNGQFDYWIVKLNATGGIQWENHYGGSGGDEAHAIQQTKDGGYIVAGAAKSSDNDVSGNYGGYDYWVVKLDASGNVQWENHYGGSEDDIARAVQQTSDNGFLVVGGSYSSDHDVSDNYGKKDYWVLKLDSSGNIQWENNYGGTDQDQGSTVLETSDGNFLVGGYAGSYNKDASDNYGSYDAWVFKIDREGKILWENNYGGSEWDQVNALEEPRDGGFILAGYSESSDQDLSGNFGGADFWVLKVDTAGAILWENNYGGSKDEEANSIVRTKDGGYMVTGFTGSDDHQVDTNYGSEDYWVLKLDDSGNIQWNNNYGGSEREKANSVATSLDEGYIVAGASGSDDIDVMGNYGYEDYWVLKLGCPVKDTTLNVTGCNSYTVPSGDETYAESGTYKDTLFTAKGCDSILTIQLAMNHVDTSVNKSDGTLISNFPSATYQWLNCGEDYYPIEGEVSSSYTPDSSGSYAVKVTRNGCTDTSRCYTVEISSGISRNDFGESLKYYPSPTTGRITIDLGQSYTGVKAVVTANSGKIVREKPVGKAQKFRLSLPEAQGLYWIKVITGSIRKQAIMKVLKR